MFTNKIKLRNGIVNFSFIAPVLVLFCVFVLLPFVQGIPISFTSWNGLSKEKEWIGFLNFKLVFEDKYFFRSLLKTIQFTLIYLVGSNCIGLGLALLIKEKTVFNKGLRAVFFMPFVISLVLSAFMWSYSYSEIIYRFFKIPSPLGTTKWVVLGLAVIAIWRDSGYCMAIHLAALQSVPKEFYEACDLEGVGKMRRFFMITLPMIVPAFTANVTLLLAWGLKVFDYPMAVTNGGPGRASETLALLVYNNIFHYYKAGYGQATAFIFTCFVFILSTFVTNFLRKREVEL